MIFYEIPKQVRHDKNKNPEPLGEIPGKNYRENKKGIVSSAFLDYRGSPIMLVYLFWLA